MRRFGGFGLLAWLLLAACWFATAQVRPLFDPDEGRYAEIPREMLASGDWITPRLNGLKYFEKPPLQYWATAAAYRSFGYAEWSSRLWAFALAFACVPLAASLAGALQGAAAARAAALALATSPYFILIGHLNLLDAAFSFWLCAAVFAFVRAQCAAAGTATERRHMLLAWACAALAVLSKGIVVGVLAGGSLIAYTLLERDLRPWRRLHVLPGLALFLGIAAPWFLLVSYRNPDFARFFFIHEHFARFLTTVHQRVEPWWFFGPLLLLGVLPWTAGALRGARAAWISQNPDWRFKPLKFLLIFVIVTILFFSSSGSKLAPYILPAMPPLAILAGCATPGRLLRSAAWTGALLVSCLGIGLLVYARSHYGAVPQAGTAWAAAAILVALAGLLGVRRPRAGVPAGGAAAPGTDAADAGAGARGMLAVAAAAVLAWQGLLCEYGVVLPARSARDIALAARPLIRAATPLYSVGQYRETLAPYLERSLVLVGYEGELRFGIDAEPGRLYLTREAFAPVWRGRSDGIAFFDPGVWREYRGQGLPGRVIAADPYTVVVSRS